MTKKKAFISQDEYMELKQQNGRAPTIKEKQTYIDGRTTGEKYYYEGVEVSKYHELCISLYDPNRKIGKRPDHLTKRHKT